MAIKVNIICGFQVHRSWYTDLAIYVCFNRFAICLEDFVGAHNATRKLNA